MLPFGVTIPANVPQGSEIPEGLMNNPVYIHIYIYSVLAYVCVCVCIFYNSYANVPQCYVIRSLPLLFHTQNTQRLM